MKKWVIGMISGLGGLALAGGTTGLGIYYGALKPLMSAVQGFIPPNKKFIIAADKKINLLELGDSLTSGYSTYKGVDATSYGDFIAGYLKSKKKLKSYDNEAIAGAKTRDLKALLVSDENIRNKVAKADVINISIGANDLIEILKIINWNKGQYSTTSFQSFLSSLTTPVSSTTFGSRVDSSAIYNYRSKETTPIKTKKTIKPSKGPLEVLFQLIDNIYDKGDKDSYINQLFTFNYAALRSKITDMVHNILAIEKEIATIQSDPNLGNNEHHAQIIFLGYEFPFTSFLNKHDPEAINIKDLDTNGDGKIDKSDEIHVARKITPLKIWGEFMSELKKTTSDFQGRNNNKNYFVQFIDVNQLPGFKWDDFRKWDSHLFKKNLFKNMPNSLDIHPSISGHRIIAEGIIKKFASSWGINYSQKEFDNKNGQANSADNLNLKNHLPYSIKDNQNGKAELFELQNGKAKSDLWASQLLQSMVAGSRTLNQNDDIKTNRLKLIEFMSKTFWNKDDKTQSAIIKTILGSFISKQTKDRTSWDSIGGWKASHPEKIQGFLERIAKYGYDATILLFSGAKDKQISKIDNIIDNLVASDPQQNSTLKPTWEALKKFLGSVIKSDITPNTKIGSIVKKITSNVSENGINKVTFQNLINFSLQKGTIESFLKIFDVNTKPIIKGRDYYKYSNLYKELKTLFASFGGTTLKQQITNIDIVKVINFMKGIDPQKLLANTPKNSLIYSIVNTINTYSQTAGGIESLLPAKLELFSYNFLHSYLPLLLIKLIPDQKSRALIMKTINSFLLKIEPNYNQSVYDDALGKYGRGPKFKKLIDDLDKKIKLQTSRFITIIMESKVIGIANPTELITDITNKLRTENNPYLVVMETLKPRLEKLINTKLSPTFKTDAAKILKLVTEVMLGLKTISS